MARPRGPKSVKVDPERILDAAQTVFAREGVKGTSIRAISREADCDPALIYYHFQNKEAVFASVLDRKLALLAPEIARLADAKDLRHTSERIWEVLQVYRRLLINDAGFRAIVRGEMASGTGGIKDAIASRLFPIVRTLSELLQQGIQRGHLRSSLRTDLGTFFLLRPYIEILDVLPSLVTRFIDAPPHPILLEAELGWFELYWRGVAAHPEARLPFLDSLKEALP